MKAPPTIAVMADAEPVSGSRVRQRLLPGNLATEEMKSSFGASLLVAPPPNTPSTPACMSKEGLFTSSAPALPGLKQRRKSSSFIISRLSAISKGFGNNASHNGPITTITKDSGRSSTTDDIDSAGENHENTSNSDVSMSSKPTIPNGVARPTRHRLSSSSGSIPTGIILEENTSTTTGPLRVLPLTEVCTYPYVFVYLELYLGWLLLQISAYSYAYGY